MYRFAKRLFLFFVVLFIIFQPALVVHAAKPWQGKTWEGNPWQGTPWDSGDLQWEGNPWEGSPWDGESWDGESWEGGPGSGQSGKGDTGNGVSEDPTNGWQGVGPIIGSNVPEAGNNPNTNSSGQIEQYLDDIGFAHNLYGFGTNVFAGGLTMHHGYRFEFHEDGRRIIVYGDRNIKERWGNGRFGTTMETVYYDERGTPRHATTYGVNTDNVDVQRHINTRTNIVQSLSDDYGLRNQFKLSNMARGGGIVGNLLTFGGNFISYSVGENSKQHGGPGMASTDFVASQITDGAIAAGTTVISAVAGSMAASAAAGSVIPGLGTVVGATVGLGIGLLMSTETGRRVRDWTKDKVKAGLDWGIDKIKGAGNFLKGLFSS